VLRKVVERSFFLLFVEFLVSFQYINKLERKRGGGAISIYASDRFQFLRTLEITLIARSCSERAILSQIGSRWQAAFTCFGGFCRGSSGVS
jgi:hypothetical protein